MQVKATKKITIAIDGPAASGKSTTAKLVAKKLGYLHIDTGAMYRAVTLKALENGADILNQQIIENIAFGSDIFLKNDNGALEVYLDNIDVTAKIRNPLVTKSVSVVSSYKGVREVMVKSQQKIAFKGGVVLEGRDIGTIVLPNADLKIFMFASVEERTKRRKKDLADSGIEADVFELKKEIEERDKKDTTRQLSPLKKANDAIELDTSYLTIDEQVNFIVEKANAIIMRDSVK